MWSLTQKPLLMSTLFSQKSMTNKKNVDLQNELASEGIVVHGSTVRRTLVEVRMKACKPQLEDF